MTASDEREPAVYVVTFRLRVLGYSPADAELRAVDAVECGAVTFGPHHREEDVRRATPEEARLHLLANGWQVVPVRIPEWHLVSGDAEGPTLNID